MSFNEQQRQQMKTNNKRTMINDVSDTDMNESIDNMTSDEMFLPQVMQPQVTINESPRFDANAVKRENNDNSMSQSQSPSQQHFRAAHYRKNFLFSIQIQI
jgi:hypothetical protein